MTEFFASSSTKSSAASWPPKSAMRWARPPRIKPIRKLLLIFGEITDFSGSGTDDSALKHILCDAIERTSGISKRGCLGGSLDGSEGTVPEGDVLDPGDEQFLEDLRRGDFSARGRGGQYGLQQLGHVHLADGNHQRRQPAPGCARNLRDGRADPSQLRPRWGLQHGCRRGRSLQPAGIGRVDPQGIRGLSPAAQRTGDAELHRDHPGVGPRSLALTRPSASVTTPSEFCPASRCPMRARPSRWPCPSSTWRMATQRQTILYGANFGRDADTIASMAGALAGALHGASGLPGEWIAKIRASGRRDQAALATRG